MGQDGDASKSLMNRFNKESIHQRYPLFIPTFKCAEFNTHHHSLVLTNENSFIRISFARCIKLLRTFVTKRCFENEGLEEVFHGGTGFRKSRVGSHDVMGHLICFVFSTRKFVVDLLQLVNCGTALLSEVHCRRWVPRESETSAVRRYKRNGEDFRRSIHKWC